MSVNDQYQASVDQYQASVSYELVTEGQFAVLRTPQIDLLFDAESAFSLGAAFQAAAKDIQADVLASVLATLPRGAGVLDEPVKPCGCLSFGEDCDQCRTEPIKPPAVTS